MNIREQASQFLVYVMSQDADLGSRLKLDIAQAGYETYFYADPDQLEVRLKQDLPHIVILDHQSLVQQMSTFFDMVLGYSSEIKFIVLTEPEYYMGLLEYKDYNVVQFFDRTAAQLPLLMLSCVDLICENLYRLYQNEQIYTSFQESKTKEVQLQQKMVEERKGPAPRPFQTRIAEYKTAESKEELLQLFFKQTPMQSWVYLKFVKSINTYIAVTHQNMDLPWVEGLSFKIPSGENEFNEKMMVGDFPLSFIYYLKSKWEVESVKILPIILKNEVEGVLVTPQDISAEVHEDFSLMSLLFALHSFESQPQFLDVEDALTGFYNQLFYKRIVEKEVDRSKRTFAPLSLIKVSIDSYRELEISQGRQFCDEVIKKVADVIKKTSRLPDYACRTGENEFSLVLTNCNRKGAALRAERLRQQLKLEAFSRTGVAVTVSQGISEYPTLTKTSESLGDSARKALDFILTKGGDKICIFKAPQDHKPDFQVNT